MKLQLHLRFTAGHYHGAEWPPSPGRLFQALVAGAHRGAYATQQAVRRDAALHWLEEQHAPAIYAPELQPGFEHIVNYVPNNDNKLDHIRAEKSLTHYTMPAGMRISYEWLVAEAHKQQAEDIAAMAELVIYLGRTIDSVIAQGQLVPDNVESSEHAMPVWRAQPHSTSGDWLVPAPGFLDHLNERYPRSVSAVQPDFSNSRRCNYRCKDMSEPIEIACFTLQKLGQQKPFAFPPWSLRSFAGLVRGAMVRWADQPTTKLAFDPDRLAQLVHGHASAEASGRVDGPHFGVLPLPSQTTDYKADGWLRHVAIIGWGVVTDRDRTLFDAMVQGLDRSVVEDRGQPRYLLQRSSRFDPLGVLEPKPSQCWQSITPVILPSLPRKGRTPEAGLLRALQQRGYNADQIHSLATFTGPLLPKTLAASDYNIARDSYIARYPRCHAELIFKGPLSAAGPLVLGAGRYQGLGLFVPVDHA